MKFVIYGAGAVGSVTGANLARVGENVILIGRSEHVDAIKQYGLKMKTPLGTYIINLPAVTHPSETNFEPDDAVLLCVKGQNTEEALQDLKSTSRDVAVFCCQNGVRNEEIAAGYFSRVYGVMVKVNSFYTTPGEVTARNDPPGSFVIGRYPEGNDEYAEKTATKLRSAGFMVLLKPNVMQYKWGKLWSNLENAVSAITNSGSPEAEFITNAARQELGTLLSEAKVLWKPESVLINEWPQVTPFPGDRVRGSTWQSLERQQGSVETEFLNGEVVRLAKRMGWCAPINEGILRIAREMATNRDLPGKYSPEQLRQKLGI